jgi:hypothetical protein
VKGAKKVENEISKEKLSASKEIETNESFDRIFQRYGPNLAAFFRDARRELMVRRDQEIAKRTNRRVEPHTL